MCVCKLRDQQGHRFPRGLNIQENTANSNPTGVKLTENKQEPKTAAVKAWHHQQERNIWEPKIWVNPTQLSQYWNNQSYVNIHKQNNIQLLLNVDCVFCMCLFWQHLIRRLHFLVSLLNETNPQNKQKVLHYFSLTGWWKAICGKNYFEKAAYEDEVGCRVSACCLQVHLWVLLCSAGVFRLQSSYLRALATEE